MRVRGEQERKEIATLDRLILDLYLWRAAITERFGGETMAVIHGQNLLDGEAAIILHEIMRAAKVESCTVTSGRRTPETQARIMYENATNNAIGFAGSRRLYGSAGDEVIDLCELSVRSGEARATTIGAMATLIREIGPERVSRHCSDRYRVFDVAPSSISPARRDDFAMAAARHPRVFRLLGPPQDPSFHIEMAKEEV